MGYRNVKELWYLLGRGRVLEDCLEVLTDDKGVCHLVNIAMLNGEAHLYVIHMVCEPKYVHMLEYFTEPEIERECAEKQVEIEVGEPQIELHLEEEDVVVVDVEFEVVAEVEAEVEGDGFLAQGQAKPQAEVEANGEADIDVGVNVERQVEAELEAEAEVEAKVVGDGFEAHCQEEAQPEVEANGEGDMDVGVNLEGQANVEGHIEVEVKGDGVEAQGQADEYDVRSWNGSEEDGLTDHGDEVEFDIFEASNQVEIGGPRGLSESDWESDTLTSVVGSDNTDDDRDGEGFEWSTLHGVWRPKRGTRKGARAQGSRVFLAVGAQEVAEMCEGGFLCKIRTTLFMNGDTHSCKIGFLCKIRTTLFFVFSFNRRGWGLLILILSRTLGPNQRIGDLRDPGDNGGHLFLCDGVHHHRRYLEPAGQAPPKRKRRPPQTR
ncbi:hypothetical protein LR48_Vigan511s005900 [Vigna angularis]|uniref:PB1-like domain-containing protein n=1 Tax=Phaseolus angularis TaxID=3914 RepID=A0A0L9TCW2_PHAAN|nr:hypothetical protein LR48_Vigan511s005900 [Vigna angularis]